MMADQASKEPRRMGCSGWPAAIHAWTRVSTAWTSADRFCLAHSAMAVCLNFARSHGRSTRGSMRSRTHRRDISSESFGLLPVISHRALFGTVTMSDSPRNRSVHHGAVMIEAKADESSFLLSLRLSSRMIGRPCHQFGGEHLANLVLVARESCGRRGRYR